MSSSWIHERVGVPSEDSSTHPPIHPLGGGTVPTTTTKIYDSIVRLLTSSGERTGIKQRGIENLLMSGLGATQPSTLRRHLEVMVRLGYLKKIGGDSAYSNAEYDIVGAKVKEIAAAIVKEARADTPWRGRPRR